MNVNTLYFVAITESQFTDVGYAILGLALVVGVWWLPGWIANARKRPNRGAIWVVNILLGWNLIGWLACLIWAFSNPPSQPENRSQRE